MVLSIFRKTYEHLFKELSDPRVYKWPLMSGPWEFLAIVAIYMFTIYRLLPSLMENRKPFHLKTVIAAYNVFQMVACILLVYGVSTSGWTTHFSLGCEPIDSSESKIAMRMVYYMWWHMVLKMIEFIETIFFVLRKKYNQVSGLHVYHHISTFYFAWVTAKYFAGGMVTFTVIINSIVHIIMYGYYFLSSFGHIMQERLAPWKRRITMIQLIQLVIIFIHSLQMLNCNIPKMVPYTYLPNMIINIILFIKFYKRSYKQQTRKSD